MLENNSLIGKMFITLYATLPHGPDGNTLDFKANIISFVIAHEGSYRNSNYTLLTAEYGIVFWYGELSSFHYNFRLLE